MKVVLAPLAAQDMREAYAHIAEDSTAAAGEALVRITNALALIASGLVSGPDVILRDGRRVKSWAVPPYRIYYRVEGEQLQVVRVYHQARRPIERRPRRRRGSR